MTCDDVALLLCGLLNGDEPDVIVPIDEIKPVLEENGLLPWAEFSRRERTQLDEVDNFIYSVMCVVLTERRHTNERPRVFCK